MARAALIEIFDSIQGEGRFVGVPMAFVRLATCPIRCLYCNTPNSYAATAAFEVRGPVGARTEPNPCDADRAVEIVGELRADRPLVASLTGGEPLVFPEFVAAFGEHVRRLGGRSHLETAALDPGALAQCIGYVDHVSADYKLPGTLESGDPRDAHLGCLECAASSPATIDVKIVLMPGIPAHAFSDALAALAPFRERVALVLQPVTPFGAVDASVDSRTLIDATRAAADAKFDVRVIPQTHKSLGVD